MYLQKQKSIYSTSLARYIESYDYYQWDSEIQNSPRLMLPEGVVEIIFVLNGAIFQSTANCPQWEARIPVFVGGLHDRAYQLSAGKKGEIFSIRFRPGAFSFFSDIPVNKLKNSLITLDNIFPKDGKELEQKILEANNIHTKTKLAEEYFRNKKIEKNMTRISLSLNEIHQSRGVISVENLARKSFMSVSHFRKVFRETVGLAPKPYASVIRINNLVQDLLKPARQLPLTELCYQYNYCDLSHFVKDITKITGMSPSQIIDHYHSGQ